MEPDTDLTPGRGGWRFATLYFLTFAALALFSIYGSLYFKRRGVSNLRLGVLYTLPAWVGTFAPLLWGIISDSRRQRRGPVVIMHAASTLLFPLFWFWNGQSFLQLCVLMAVFSFFYRTSIPLTDAWTLDHITHQGGDYGRLRSWGSIGFITPLFVSILLLKQSAVADVRDLLPVFYGFVGFRAITAIYAATLPDYQPSQRMKLDWRSLAVYLRPYAATFFFCVFMNYFLFGPYYTFFSVYLDEQGIADNLKGVFWVVAVGSESVLIAASGQLIKRFGATSLLLWGLSASVVRLFVLSLEPSWYFILVTQVLHALTFGAFHVASIQIIHKITPESFRATGQTFTGGLLALGGIVGGTVGGFWAETYGIAGLFRMLSLVALITVVLAATAFHVWKPEN